MQTSETFLHKHYPHLREDFTTSNSTRVDFPSYLSLSLFLNLVTRVVVQIDNCNPKTRLFQRV